MNEKERAIVDEFAAARVELASAAAALNEASERHKKAIEEYEAKKSALLTFVGDDSFRRPVKPAA